VENYHYRNHGAAFGKVLLGVQMPQSEKRDFQQSLNELGFEYQEETKNPAYNIFLGGM